MDVVEARFQVEAREQCTLPQPIDNGLHVWYIVHRQDGAHVDLRDVGAHAILKALLATRDKHYRAGKRGIRVYALDASLHNP